VGLKVLNLAWNGFGESGAVAVASALEECMLTTLDLSCNRINSQGFLRICQAVEGNEDIRVLKVRQIQRLHLVVFNSKLLVVLLTLTCINIV